MAIQQDITAADGFFTNEDKSISFEVLQPDGLTPQDVTGWALEWQVRAAVSAADPATLSKTSAAGISVTGTYNATRNLNTQRVLVLVAASDTASLQAGRYQHALKRTDPGSETILSFGSFWLLDAAAH